MLKSRKIISMHVYVNREILVKRNKFNKVYRIEVRPYHQVWNHIYSYFRKNNFNLKKSPEGVLEKWNKKANTNETELTLLHKIYAQWFMVYETYKLVNGKDYDIIIRSRFDYDISKMDLSKYTIEKNTNNYIIIFSIY